MKSGKTPQNGPSVLSGRRAANPSGTPAPHMNGRLRPGEPTVDVHYKEGELLERDFRALAGRLCLRGSDARRIMDEWAVEHAQEFAAIARVTDRSSD